MYPEVEHCQTKKEQTACKSAGYLIQSKDCICNK